MEPDYDPVNFDPYKGDFPYICNAFYSSIKSPRILLDQIQLPEDDCAAIAKAIKNGKARLVSGGSYFPEKDAGGSVFIISAGKRKDNSLIGFNWSPGTKEDQNPYRSELIGIDGGLSALAVILNFYEITEGGIEIALDGESAMNQAKDKDGYLHISQTLYDILQDIRN